MATQMHSAITADRSWMPRTGWSQLYRFRDGFRASRSEDFGQLPEGFPNQINAKMAWMEADEYHERPSKYRSQVNVADREEIENAVRSFQATGLPLDKLSMMTFPLPNLGPKIQKMAQEIHNGHGFFVLSGLDPKRYSNQINVVIYAGLSSYIGERRGRQDEYGNMLLHLTDLGPGAAPDNERQAPYSSVSQPFHTDSGSILGLYCLSKASVGGESKLASSARIYNQIARSRPDLIRVLARDDWVFDSFGQSPLYSTRPILHRENGKLIFSFSRRPLVGSPTSPRTQSIPDLTEEQVEALNLVQSLAEESCITFNLEPGEVLFWNNLGLLHSRSSFPDYLEPKLTVSPLTSIDGFTDMTEEKRHLIRIWLHNDEHTWSIPPAIKKAWDDSFSDKGLAQLWPLRPIEDREYISTQQRSSGHS